MLQSFFIRAALLSVNWRRAFVELRGHFGGFSDGQPMRGQLFCQFGISMVSVGPALPPATVLNRLAHFFGQIQGIKRFFAERTSRVSTWRPDALLLM